MTSPELSLWACAGHGDKFNKDCDECCWVKRCNALEATLRKQQQLLVEAREVISEYAEEFCSSDLVGIVQKLTAATGA